VHLSRDPKISLLVHLEGHAASRIPLEEMVGAEASGGQPQGQSSRAGEELYVHPELRESKGRFA
jgi:hypothetical protein